MGVMIDGVWNVDEPPIADRLSGEYTRAQSGFRDWVTPDGKPGRVADGLGGDGGFRAEVGRYHLYVSISCPWAHRTRIFRILKALEGAVGLSMVMPRRDERGWIFDPASEEFRDDLNGSEALHELYGKANPTYSGRVTVPVLWDRKKRTIVSNESSEIIRMLNSAFIGVAGNDVDFYPVDKRVEIDALNEITYNNLNNGVYRAGFATSQEAYEAAATAVFETLDMLEDLLATRRYLVGTCQTEADWRVFPTLVRFDAAYHGAFKCNKRRLIDYPNLWNYTRDLYVTASVAETVDPVVSKYGYYSKSDLRNPFGIVSKGPEIDFAAPHNRAALAA
ncbi:MAG: glutathione S-transferase family protein [Rhodospirillaceae bacterium]|nr:glutathione S-transferase family protein [Rhodospirillaceae bacterium]